MSGTGRIKMAVLASMIIVLLSFSMFPMHDPSSGTQSTTYIIPMEDWIQNSDVNAIRLVNTLLEANVSVYWALDSFSAGGNTYPAGTFYIPTPFTAMNGLSSNDLMSWFLYQGKLNHVWRIDTTTDSISVNSKKLVLPRITLFYDTTTYDNALVNYEVLQSMGFKVILANALDLYSKAWNETGSVLSQSNVFIMPGGAMHLWAFPYANMTQGINNIDEFVANGGGFMSICAGSTEALAGSPWANLGLVNASYYNDWFVYSSPDQGDWDWRTLIGPVYLNVTQPNNPVMFGYGQSAVRPGYGPMPTMYYYGGPAFTNVSSGVTVLATYGAPVTQKATAKVSDIWGAPAILETNYGRGKVVTFGPHPEWPAGGDPGARMYAQTLYYVANIPKPDPLGSPPSTTLSAAAISDHVNAITSTVAQIKPVLDDITRTADDIVNMRVGDHYNPVGLWYDQVLLEYSQAMYSQLNTIQATAVKLQYEYAKLDALKGMVQNNPQQEGLITYSQEMISKFFNYTANLPLDPMIIPSTDWTGMGPFANFTVADEATTFGQLTQLFVRVNNETSNVLLPFAKSYLPLYNEFNTLYEENLTSFTPSINATLASLYMNITESYPAAGPLYRGMDTFEHTLDIVQYKIDENLLNIQTLGDRTMEIVSQSDYALASAVGPFAYASAQLQAAWAYPEGALLSGS